MVRMLTSVFLLSMLIEASAPEAGAVRGMEPEPCGDGGWAYVDSGAAYAVEVSLPPVACEHPPIADSLMEYTEGLVSGFMDNLTELDTGPMRHILEINVFHEPSPNGLVCLMAYFFAYEGGAHGMFWNRSWIYDLAADGFIEPVSLIGDSASFVEFAGQVRDSLLAVPEMDSEWVAEGTAPIPSNYTALVPVPDSTGGIAGFSVSFPPYQVGPYVMGSHVVFVSR